VIGCPRIEEKGGVQPLKKNMASTLIERRGGTGSTLKNRIKRYNLSEVVSY